MCSGLELVVQWSCGSLVWSYVLFGSETSFESFLETCVNVVLVGVVVNLLDFGSDYECCLGIEIC
jgi:hypothetical protein